MRSPLLYKFSSLLQSILRTHVRATDDINNIDNAIKLPALIDRPVLRFIKASIPLAISRQNPIDGMYKTRSAVQ